MRIKERDRNFKSLINELSSEIALEKSKAETAESVRTQLEKQNREMKLRLSEIEGDKNFAKKHIFKFNYDQEVDALQAAYTEREKIEAELQRKDQHCVTLMNEIELLKKEKTEIQELISTIYELQSLPGLVRARSFCLVRNVQK